MWSRRGRRPLPHWVMPQFAGPPFAFLFETAGLLRVYQEHLVWRRIFPAHKNRRLGLRAAIQKERRDPLIKSLLYGAPKPDCPIERSRKGNGSVIPDLAHHADRAVDLSRDGLGLRSRKTRVQDDNANIVLKGAEQMDERFLAYGLGLAQRVQEDDLFGRIAVPAEMHDVRPVLAEGLKQVIRTNGPPGDELKGVAMIGGADLGFNFPCFFIQFKLLRAGRMGLHKNDFGFFYVANT